MTAITHAVQVGKSSNAGMISIAKVGSNSQWNPISLLIRSMTRTSMIWSAKIQPAGPRKNWSASATSAAAMATTMRVRVNLGTRKTVFSLSGIFIGETN